jgi:hypothetical protein
MLHKLFCFVQKAEKLICTLLICVTCIIAALILKSAMSEFANTLLYWHP